MVSMECLIHESHSCLSCLQGRLSGLQKEFNATALSAQNILGGLLGSPGEAISKHLSI